MKIYDFILNKIVSGLPIASILISNFKSSKEILEANNDFLVLLLKKNSVLEENIKHFLEKKEQYFSSLISSLERAKLEMTKIEEEGIKIISISDSNYPRQLREIPNPPLVLYAKGNIDFDYNKSISIVGTRDASSFAINKVSEITSELVKKGFCVISGLARGIDGAAHRATINSGGKTIAVLAFGMKHIYPSEHITLSKEILKNNGALISENFNWTPVVDRSSFKERNRIISGLSKAVFIVEGSIISGSLSQYNHAKNQKKLIFTLKPNVSSGDTSLSKKIIAEGGFPVETTEDILRVINQRQSKLN